jgi:hypothetical protein
MSTIGTRNVDNTYFEWSEVDLAAAASNRQIEGDVGHMPTLHQLMRFARAATHRFLQKLLKFHQQTKQ